MLLAAILCTLSQAGPPVTSALDSLRQRLPDSVGDWRGLGDGERYDPETIFSYIDGHAEVYLAYGMQACLSRRYNLPQGSGEITLDIFALDSPAGAFGVFTHNREGEEVALGQGGVVRQGWLAFWKGRFFVSVYYAEEETARSREAMLELARRVAEAIDESGALPAIVRDLPSAGRVEKSVRYLCNRDVLAYHLPSLVGTQLHITSTTPVALASYERGGVAAKLLLIDYASVANARAVGAEFARLAATAEKKGLGRTAAAQRHGRRWVAVLGTDSKALATELLKEAARPSDHGGEKP
jgi:hypothetical protein